MNTGSAELRRIEYDDDVVRSFTLATIVWALVALLLGVIIATQLPFWQANLKTSWLTFGRLRPLHTNAAIFAFVGNMMFAGIYYSTQRLLKTRMASDFLSRVHFWGWQLVIASAAVSLAMGLSQSKEYAELIWPIDIMVVLVWVAFAVNFFWTLARRNEPNLYVALWFYIATIVTIAVLYIVNNLQIPTGFLHSYPIYAGVQDALVQWWYGHNAVGFFLTTPILGIMYYFVPKAAGRPVYSYRLSVVHFWALVFVYIWAGPHHLLNTSLPDWAQSLGTVFSIILLAPSWGGMVNGLLTIRGAWTRVREEPILKFFIAAITFYGMSTFEGPLLSLKSVNGLAHYTDWIVGHVHGGALGWNGFMAAGMLYWLVPKLWNTRLHSNRLAEAHFWMGTFGILLYMVAMWISGVNQGLYWRALDGDGFLRYPDFVQGLLSVRLLHVFRLIGGIAYMSGFVLMTANLLATILGGRRAESTVEVMVTPRPPSPSFWKLATGAPVVLSVLAIGLALLLGRATPASAAAVITGGIVVTVAAILVGALKGRQPMTWHRLVEGKPLAFTLFVLVTILIGGIVELIPTVVIRRSVPPVAQVEASTLAGEPSQGGAPSAPGSGGESAAPSTMTAAGGAEMMAAGGEVAEHAAVTPSKFTQQPYSPLELEGRDIYVREGCYNCHSQMIRPFRFETLRYGEYSRLEESIYDFPFQFGSKRTGPDLHREGGKYPNLWHYQHMMDPRSISPGSNMPAYPWLKTARLDFEKTARKLKVMKKLGVPYEQSEIERASVLALAQADVIVADLALQGVEIDPRAELIALTAYLQRLGRGPQFQSPLTAGEATP